MNVLRVYCAGIPAALRPREAFRVRRPDAGVAHSLRAMAAMGLPLLACLLLGRGDLTVFAAFGSFTALYGREQPYPLRGRLMAVAAVGLVLCTAAGGVLAAADVSPWWNTVVIAVVAVGAKLVTDALRTGPPAGVMFMLVAGVTAIVPLGWPPLPAAVGAVAASAAFAWTVAMAGGLAHPLGPVRLAVARALDAVVRCRQDPDDLKLRHAAGVAVEGAWQALRAVRGSGTRKESLAVLTARAESVVVGAAGAVAVGELRTASASLRGHRALPTHPAGPGERAEISGRIAAAPSSAGWGPALRAALHSGSPAWLRAGRVGLGVLAAGWLATALGLGHAYWAPLAATAVLASTNVTTTAHRVMQRASGTVLGVLIAGAVLSLPLPLAGLVAVAALANFAVELTVVTNYAVGLVFITPLTMTVQELATSTPPGLLMLDRLVDTLIGAVVGLCCCLLVVNTRYAESLRHAVRRCEDAVADLTTVWAMGARLQVAGHRDRLASRLRELRELSELARGEPAHHDAPTRRALRVERNGYRALARTAPRPRAVS